MRPKTMSAGRLGAEDTEEHLAGEIQNNHLDSLLLGNVACKVVDHGRCGLILADQAVMVVVVWNAQ